MSNYNTDETEIITAQAVNTDMVYQQDKAVVDMQIATAKQYPRNLKRSIDNAIAIVTLDKETAQACTYSLPRGGKKITGPSVHLAKIIAQNWGNLRVEAKVVDISDRQITSQAIAFDLENNLAIKVEVKRSIFSKRNGRFDDDMITVTGNAANAIALRNAIYAVIPKNVTDKVYKSALNLITGDLSTEQKMKAKRKELFDNLKGAFNVTDEEILFAIGKQSIDFVTADDIVTLMGTITAIKDGDTTVDQVFRSNKVKETVKDTRSELLKFIQDEAQTLDALESVATKVQPNTEEHKAYEAKFAELSKTADQNADKEDTQDV